MILRKTPRKILDFKMMNSLPSPGKGWGWVPDKLIEILSLRALPTVNARKASSWMPTSLWPIIYTWCFVKTQKGSRPWLMFSTFGSWCSQAHGRCSLHSRKCSLALTVIFFKMKDTTNELTITGAQLNKALAFIANQELLATADGFTYHEGYYLQ